MAEVVKRKKALSVSPLKASQPVGGSLACLGFNRAIPMLHGSQGCTAFAKVYFVRHFREPIPLQTTAMDQASSVLGADENVIEGLKNVAEKSNPGLIALLTTGLAETQGCDIRRNVREFRDAYPQFSHVAVVPVTTPDFTGCLESGYAVTVHEVLATLVPERAQAGTQPGRRLRQVNILAGSLLTPGDVETLKELIESFGLRPVLVPDLAESLDGHLDEDEFSPVTTGGTPLSELATLGDALATLVIGASLRPSGELLEQKTGVPSHYFDHIHGLKGTDALVLALSQISGQPVPDKLERQRSQLQDAMLDCHFFVGQLKVAIAADPDLLAANVALLQEIGAEIVVAVAPANAPVLRRIPLDSIQIGDLEDLENGASRGGVELVIGNSHAAQSAERLGVPILRNGFPLYDTIGAYQKTWIGYRGTRQALFDIANLALSFAVHTHAVPTYHSIYKQRFDLRNEGEPQHEHRTPHVHSA